MQKELQEKDSKRFQLEKQLQEEDSKRLHLEKELREKESKHIRYTKSLSHKSIQQELQLTNMDNEIQRLRNEVRSVKQSLWEKEEYIYYNMMGNRRRR